MAEAGAARSAPDRDVAIDVRGLRKLYGTAEAVAGVDLRIYRGEIFAILGPNGAGKTTAVEILEGHRQRSAGDVSVLGHDPGLNERSLKERVGIVLQETNVDPYLTVEETIDLFRGYYPHPRPLEEVLELVGLVEQRATRVRRLSGGQQRRLDVAIGLAGDPELLFLDEPTTGFDPAARRGAWHMISGLKDLGKTVLLTTHYLDEAEQLADRVAIMAKGKVIAEGTPEELTGADPASRVRFRVPAAAAGALPEIEGLEPETDGFVTISTASPTRTLFEITRWALEHDVELEDLSLRRPSLEDVYLRLVGAEDALASPAAVGVRRRGRR